MIAVILWTLHQYGWAQQQIDKFMVESWGNVGITMMMKIMLQFAAFDRYSSWWKSTIDHIRVSGALGMLGSGLLSARGDMEGYLVIIDEYDFDFIPAETNISIPQELLDKDAKYKEMRWCENAKRQQQTPRGILIDDFYDE